MEALFRFRERSYATDLFNDFAGPGWGSIAINGGQFRLKLLTSPFGYIPMKYILILALLFYVFYKVTSFFFRAGVSSGQSRQQRQAPEGKKPKDNGTIKGGEYIDYEDVK